MWEDRELELWKEITTTEVWGVIVKEIDRRIRNSMESLTVCGPQDLIRIQASIKAYNELKTMPESVVSREEGQASQ